MFSARDFHKNLLSTLEFLEDSFRVFHIYIQIWVKLGMSRVCRVVLGVCEFCENQRREGCTFRVGVNNITFTRLP